LPVEKELSYAIEKGYFKHERMAFQHRGGWMQSETTIQKEALVAWTSSPKALIDILNDTIDDNYNVKFINQRRSAESSTANSCAIESLSYEQDAKFMALIMSEGRKKEGRKVIVFFGTAGDLRLS